METAEENNLAAENIGRRRTARLLAAAQLQELRSAMDALAVQPQARLLRGPETGLVMVRGRIGGGGEPFNLGETTVTRASVMLDSGTAGHAQALGTDREKVRLAAIFDALWQEDENREQVEALLLGPVAGRVDAEDRQRDEETAATRVDFFTMVRGED